MRGKETFEVVTFRGSPPPDSHIKWVGQQDATEIPNGGRLLDSPPGFPDGLLVIEDDQWRQRIIVSWKQRERLTKQEHLPLLHVGSERVFRALIKRYYWHKMNDLVKRIVMSCHDVRSAGCGCKGLALSSLRRMQTNSRCPDRNMVSTSIDMPRARSWSRLTL